MIPVQRAQDYGQEMNVAVLHLAWFREEFAEQINNFLLLPVKFADLLHDSVEIAAVQIHVDQLSQEQVERRPLLLLNGGSLRGIDVV